MVVPIRNDNLHEPTESFLARLSLPAGQAGVLLDRDTTTVTIEDDDGTYVRLICVPKLYRSLYTSYV